MSNEAFEKWAIDYGLDYESSFTRDDVEASWQAARADSESILQEQQNTIAELKANINDLREALNDCYYEVNTNFAKIIKELISKTPAQHINNDVLIFTKDSLQEHDNATIEKCAKVCDEMNNEYGWGEVAANTIRLLKGKQNES